MVIGRRAARGMMNRTGTGEDRCYWPEGHPWHDEVMMITGRGREKIDVIGRRDTRGMMIPDGDGRRSMLLAGGTPVA